MWNLQQECDWYWIQSNRYQNINNITIVCIGCNANLQNVKKRKMQLDCPSTDVYCIQCFMHFVKMAISHDSFLFLVESLPFDHCTVYTACCCTIAIEKCRHLVKHGKRRKYDMKEKIIISSLLALTTSVNRVTYLLFDEFAACWLHVNLLYH